MLKAILKFIGQILKYFLSKKGMVGACRFLALLWLSTSLLDAQDFHWSQIHLNPSYLNPAFTGFAKKKNRVTGLYRDQWRSVPVPYSSTNIAYDRNLFQNEDKGWRLGAGAQLLYDKAGDGALSTFRPGISLAVGKYINDNKQLVQLGINTSYSRKQIDFSQLKFDSQYDGSNYHPDLPHNELVSNDKAGYFDIGLGLNFYTQLKKVGGLDVGFSVFNLNQPNYTFLSGAKQSVAPRISTYTKARLGLGMSDWSFHPGVYYQNQNKAQETLVQAIFGVQLGELEKQIELQFGPGYRVGDAVVAFVGVNWKDLKVGFAFDGNTSDLRAATRGSGAYELAVNYEWERKKKEEPESFEPPVEEEVEEKIEEEIEEEILVPVVPFEHQLTHEERLDSIVNQIKLRPFVQLFFANDHPHPKTRVVSSSLSYEETYIKYLKELNQIVNDESSSFALKVASSFNELEVLMNDVLELLEGDKSIEIEIGGFASPLSNPSYNVNLTKRRVATLINYVYSWNDGALSSYLKQGQLRVRERAFGASQADETVSDDPNDKARSIYSVEAAYERRVEMRVTSIE